MYKLMLVDDEAIVRQSVINKIKWQEYGFEIVCEAENGAEAFEYFEQYLPDVLITDIKMPYMDGLQLAEKILKKYPFTKIIILTGFDEFEYAKKGIDLHITHYIVKPISSKELIKILLEVKERIDKEINEKQDVEKLKKHYEKSYPIMKNRFLESIVKGEYDYENVDELLNHYQIDLKGKMYIVSVIKIDGLQNNQIPIEYSHIELKKIALLDMVKDIQKRNNIGVFFLIDHQIVIISKNEEDSEASFVQKTFNKLEEIRQGVEKYLPFTVTIGIGHICEDIVDLPNSLKAAVNAQDYKVVLGNNQVICIQDLEKNEKVHLELSERQERELIRLLKVGTKEQLYTFTEDIFYHILASNTSIQDYQIYLVELFTVVIKTLKQLKLDITEIIIHNQGPLELLLNDEPLEEIKKEFNRICEKIIDINAAKRINTTMSAVARAKEYVKNHYTDPDLNIEKISEYLHYSPNYFSSIFKKETGQAFMNYLMDVRLEAAKDLLCTTEMKTFEVALEVGFSTANYFSFCFKKIEGLSPSKYRKNMKEVLYTKESLM